MVVVQDMPKDTYYIDAAAGWWYLSSLELNTPIFSLSFCLCLTIEFPLADVGAQMLA